MSNGLGVALTWVGALALGAYLFPGALAAVAVGLEAGRPRRQRPQGGGE